MCINMKKTIESQFNERAENALHGHPLMNMYDIPMTG
jgi:hypothetical protein